MRRFLLAAALLSACEPTVEEQVVEYTTADQPVDEGGEGVVGAPRLCVAGSNVYAVWHDDRRGGRNQVFFDVGRAGGAAWGEFDEQLSTDPGGDAVAENPSIACAGESVYVVWEDDRDSLIGHKNIYLRWSDDAGRTWSSEVLLVDDPEGDFDAIRPQILVDWDPAAGPDKTLYVVWTDDRWGAYDVFLNRGTNGYNWLDEDQRLDGDEPGSAYSARPQIVSDGVGGVYVAWEDSRDGANDIFVNRSRDFGFNWDAAPARVDEAGGTTDSFGATMAIDKESTVPAVYVAWHDDRHGAKDVFLNYSLNAGDTWQQEAQRLDADGEGANDSFYPTVAASDGKVLVAWHDARDVGFDVRARTSENGGNSWNGEVRLDADVAGAAHSLRPKAVRSGDRLAVVWSDYRTGREHVGDAYPDLWYRTSGDGGVVWSENDGRIDDDPQATAISEQHQVVMAGPTVHVLWVDYRAGNADLWYRGVPVDGPPQE